MNLPPLQPHAPVPDAWEAHFGPLERAFVRPGLQGLRLLQGSPETWLSVHDDPKRADLEFSVAERPFPFLAPRFGGRHKTFSGQQVLVFVDPPGSDPAGPIPGDRLEACARLIGQFQSQPPPNWLQDHPRALAARVRGQALSEPLADALARFLPLGDQFCHRAIHRGGIAFSGEKPIGFRRLLASTWGDAEEDLADLLFAVHAGQGTVPDRDVERVCAAWEDQTGRHAERNRVRLYLWLRLEEAGDGAAAAVGEAWSLEGMSGARRFGRWLTPGEGAPWAQAEPADHLEAVHRDLVRVTGKRCHKLRVYAGEATQDVVRFVFGGQPRVAKIFTTPIWPGRFGFEQALCVRLSGSAAALLAPLKHNGGVVLRVAERPAVLLDDAGDDKVSRDVRGRKRLAVAHAALHAAGDLVAAYPHLPVEAEPAGDGELGAWAVSTLTPLWPRLPRTLVHRSLYGDHAGWSDFRDAVVLHGSSGLMAGVRIGDLVRTGWWFAGDPPDPVQWVRYLVEAHRVAPLDRDEVAAAVPLLALHLQQLDPASAARVHHNHAGLTGALRKALG